MINFNTDIVRVLFVPLFSGDAAIRVAAVAGPIYLMCRPMDCANVVCDQVGFDFIKDAA